MSAALPPEAEQPIARTKAAKPAVRDPVEPSESSFEARLCRNVCMSRCLSNFPKRPWSRFVCATGRQRGLTEVEGGDALLAPCSQCQSLCQSRQGGLG